MRCRSGVIITPPKRDDPTLCFWHTTVFLPQSGFVQQAIALTTSRVTFHAKLRGLCHHAAGASIPPRHRGTCQLHTYNSPCGQDNIEFRIYRPNSIVKVCSQLSLVIDLPLPVHPYQSGFGNLQGRCFIWDANIGWRLRTLSRQSDRQRQYKERPFHMVEFTPATALGSIDEID